MNSATEIIPDPCRALMMCVEKRSPLVTLTTFSKQVR